MRAEAAAGAHECAGVAVLGRAVARALSPQAFFERVYLRSIAPVLLRGLALDWPERVAWVCAVLLNGHAGHARFAPSAVPYGRAFGGEAAAAISGLPKTAKNLSTTG